MLSTVQVMRESCYPQYFTMSTKGKEERRHHSVSFTPAEPEGCRSSDSWPHVLFKV